MSASVAGPAAFITNGKHLLDRDLFEEAQSRTPKPAGLGALLTKRTVDAPPLPLVPCESCLGTGSSAPLVTCRPCGGLGGRVR